MYRKTVILTRVVETLTVILVLLGAYGILHQVEQAWFPVLKEWSPAGYEIQGSDLLVWGSVLKALDCEYKPPIRAVNQRGEHLPVKSLNPTSGQNWLAADGRRSFGPWLVIGGAKARVTLYAEHECHPLWQTFSVLGTLDTR